MKFKLTYEQVSELKKALTFCCKATARNSPFKLIVHGSNLIMSTTHHRFGAKLSFEMGYFRINPNELKDVIGSMKSGIALEFAVATLNITSDALKAAVKLAIDEIGSVYTPDPKQIKIEDENLLGDLIYCSNFGNEKEKQDKTIALLHFKENEALATNRYRMCRLKIKQNLGLECSLLLSSINKLSTYHKKNGLDYLGCSNKSVTFYLVGGYWCQFVKFDAVEVNTRNCLAYDSFNNEIDASEMGELLPTIKACSKNPIIELNNGKVSCDDILAGHIETLAGKYNPTCYLKYADIVLMRPLLARCVFEKDRLLAFSEKFTAATAYMVGDVKCPF